MAAQHWNNIAQDAVERTQAALSKISPDKPLYITDSVKSEFDKAFRKYMIANFIATGIPVSTKKEGSIEVKYETQVIRHASVFEPDKFGYKPGMATTGMASFWILRDVFETMTTSNALGTVAGAGAYDAYKATNPDETGVEFILTTSIINDDRYLMLNADAYYIEKAEAWLFEGCAGKNRRYCR